MKHLALLVITIAVLVIVASTLDVRCGVTATGDLVVVACRAGRLAVLTGVLR